VSFCWVSFLWVSFWVKLSGIVLFCLSAFVILQISSLPCVILPSVIPINVVLPCVIILNVILLIVIRLRVILLPLHLQMSVLSIHKRRNALLAFILFLIETGDALHPYLKSFSDKKMERLFLKVSVGDFDALSASRSSVSSWRQSLRTGHGPTASWPNSCVGVTVGVGVDGEKLFVGGKSFWENQFGVELPQLQSCPLALTGKDPFLYILHILVLIL